MEKIKLALGRKPIFAKWEPWKLERGPLALPNLQKTILNQKQ
jgi:hypothetical protein